MDPDGPLSTLLSQGSLDIQRTQPRITVGFNEKIAAGSGTVKVASVYFDMVSTVLDISLANGVANTPSSLNGTACWVNTAPNR
jgi:hypothetical protein